VTSFKSFSNSRPATVWLRLAAALTAAMTVCLLFVAAPAGAFVKTSDGVTVGLQPRDGVEIRNGLLVGERGLEEKGNEATIWEQPEADEAETFENNAGNPVLHSEDVYTIFWDPVHRYDADWERLMSGFAQGVGAESGTLDTIFAVDTQYTDKTNEPANYHVTYRGSYADTDAYPKAGCVDPDALETNTYGFEAKVTCLNDAQLKAELQTFVADHKLPTGMGSIFYIVTPPGAAVCLTESAESCSDDDGSEESYNASFCSYHSFVNPDKAPNGDSSTILYGVLPWTAGGLGDGYFAKADRTDEYPCQDGGFDPTTLPRPEEPEHAKERSPAEEEAFKKANNEEKRVILEREALESKPHPEEPNQVDPSEDGYFDAGLADLMVNQLAEEEQNIVTDPLLDAWQDSAGREASDECRNYFNDGKLEGSSTPLPGSDAGTVSNARFGTTHYYLQDAFNLAAIKLGYPGLSCVGADRLEPSFTAPNTVNAGDIVGFNGGGHPTIFICHIFVELRGRNAGSDGLRAGFARGQLPE
jgi:hypothetical protein